MQNDNLSRKFNLGLVSLLPQITTKNTEDTIKKCNILKKTRMPIGYIIWKLHNYSQAILTKKSYIIINS